MPRYEITSPDGRKFEITAPEGASQAEVLAYAQSNFPRAEAPKKSTISSELKRGAQQMASSVQTAYGALAGSPEEAARAGNERGEAISQVAGEGASLDAVKKAYQEKGLLSAAGELASQVPRALAGQGANLAAMAGGARLGAMAGSAVAPGVGTVVGGALGAGAALLPQLFGSNVESQAAAQMERGEPIKIDRTKAGVAAAGQAALEGAGAAFTLGKGVVKGILGITDDAAVTSAKAAQQLEATAQRSLAASAGRGVARGAVVEMPVEVAQQVIERAQAGQDLTSDEAMKEYGEAAYQAGLVGGPLGAAGNVVTRGQAREKLEAKAAADAAQAAPAAPPEPSAPSGGGTQLAIPAPETQATPEEQAALPAPEERLALPNAPTPESIGEAIQERERLKARPQTADITARVEELDALIDTYNQSDVEVLRGEQEQQKAEEKQAAAEAAEVRNRFPGLVGAVEAEGAAPGAFTMQNLVDTGVPMGPGVKSWAQENVIGKTREDVQALVAKDPALVEGKTQRAALLRELTAPQPTKFEEAPRVEPTPTPAPAVEQRDEPRAGEPSVGVSSEPTAPVVSEPGTGAPVAAETPAAPDGLGLVSAGQPAVQGAKPESTEPTAVTKPVTMDPRMVARIDAVEAKEEEREQAEYATQRADMVAAFKEKHDRNVKAAWAAVQRARQALKTTTPQSSIAANDIDSAIYALEDAAQRYDRFVNDESVSQKALDSLEATVNDIPQRIADLDSGISAAKAPTKPKGRAKAKVEPKAPPAAEKTLQEKLQAIIDDKEASKGSKRVAFQALDLLDDPKANKTADDRKQSKKYAEELLRSAENQRRFAAPRGNGQTLADLEQEIQAMPGKLGDAVRKMRSTGKLKLEEGDGTKGGLYDGKRATLYARGTPKGQALGMLLHEVGAHMGMQKLLGQKQYDAVIDRIVAMMSAPKGSLERRLASTAFDRIPAEDRARGAEVARDELVAYFVEGVAYAEADGQLPKRGPLRVMWDQIKTAITTNINRTLGTSFGTNDLTPQQIADIATAAIFAESKTGVSENAPAKQQFSRTYTAQDVVDSMGELTPTQERGVLGMFAGAKVAGEPSRGTKFRVAVADSAAAIEDKLSGHFNGAVRDSLGKLNPMGLYRQAQDYSKLLLEYFQGGTLEKDKTTGQYRVTGSAEIGAPMDVFKLVQAWGKKTGRSPEQAEQFASRVIEAHRLEQVLKVNPDFPKHIKDADRALLVAEYDADPAFAEMNAAMDKPRIELIKQMVKVGRLSAEVGAEWSSVVGYVPFDRIDDFTDSFSMVKKTSGRSPLMLTKDPELKGSFDRPVGNVFENYLNTMGWMVGQVINNDARVQTLRSLEDLQFTGKPSRVAGTKNRTAKAYIKGELMYWELPSSYDAAAFQELNPPKAQWLRVLGQASTVLRRAVTVLPPFALKQVTDDVQRAIMTSGVKNPGALLRMTLTNFGGMAYAELRGIQHPTVKEFGALGLTGEYDFQQGKPAVSTLKDLGYRPRGKFETLMHRLDGITRASDLAVRKAIYDQTLIETQGDALLAQTRAREFINFRRRGASDFVGAMVTTIPFFNAYIQGMDVLYRAASGKDSSSSVDRAQARRMFWSRASTVMVLSSLYALGKGDDDEDYNDMDLRTRDSNWILPGGYKLPAPTELGALFKVIPERIVEYMRRQGTPEEQTAWEATRTALSYIFEQYVGRTVPVPQGVKPLLEAWTNYSFFTGRELEGIYQKQQDPSMRRASNTSELAIAISEFSRDVVGVDKVSPILIDNALNGYFGSSAGLLVAVTDSLLNPTRVDRPLHKYALISNYMYDPVGTRRMTEFYEEREKVGRANTTLRELMKTDLDKAAEYAEKHADELMLESAVNSTLEQLERTRAYKKHLNSKLAAEDMTADERADQIKEVRQMEVQLTSWLREAKASLRQ